MSERTVSASSWVGSGSEQPATPRQLRYLQAVAREAGYDSAALDNRAQLEFQRNANQLTRNDASMLIDLLQAERKQWGAI